MLTLVVPGNTGIKTMSFLRGSTADYNKIITSE